MLGAGASHDCIPDWQLLDPDPGIDTPGLPIRPLSTATPPLTQDLAKATPLAGWALDRWPEARPAIGHLRATLDDAREPYSTNEVKSLEASLAKFVEEGSTINENLRSVLGFRFFIRDLIWASTNYMMASDVTAGVTNYTYLVQSLLKWASRGERCVVITSFNYDLLLERAMESSWGFDPTKMDSYLSHRTINLLKPHGSVQWEWPVKNGIRLGGSPTRHGRASIRAALENGEDRSNIIVRPHATFERYESEPHRQLAVPAMALPIDGKSELCWPTEQASRFQSLIGTVTHFITIGWRGLEEHFTPNLRPIVKSDARALIVTKDPNDCEGHEIAHRLRVKTDSSMSNWEVASSGFTDLIRSSTLDDFLSSH